MRPVKKGRPCKVYTQYGDAKPDLYTRLGLQCCYCEQNTKLENIAVEHIFPKEKHPCCRLLWSNFLLSCTLCNSIKGTTDIFFNNEHEYIFPDRDDTYRGIIYPKAKGYQPAANLKSIDDQRAKNTLNLYGKINPCPTPKHIVMVTERASRWKKEGDEAAEQRKFYLRLDSATKKQYLYHFKKYASDNCWSIWMHAFEDIPEVKEIILYALPNTAIEYFIDDYWEHEQYFKKKHTPQECYDKLLAVIQSRIDYINGHINKLSSFQKAGIVEWAMNFTREVTNKIKFTTGQIIEINKVIEALKAI